MKCKSQDTLCSYDNQLLLDAFGLPSSHLFQLAWLCLCHCFL